MVYALAIGKIARGFRDHLSHCIRRDHALRLGEAVGLRGHYLDLLGVNMTYFFEFNK